MTIITNELMYGLLKRIQADTSVMRSEIREIKVEINALRGTVIAVQQDIHNIYGIPGDYGVRIERIERRLDLREMAEAGTAFDHHS